MAAVQVQGSGVSVANPQPSRPHRAPEKMHLTHCTSQSVLQLQLKCLVQQSSYPWAHPLGAVASSQGVGLPGPTESSLDPHTRDQQGIIRPRDGDCLIQVEPGLSTRHCAEEAL